LEKPYAKTAQHNGFRDSVLGSHCGARGWSNSAARCKSEQRDQGRATDDNATADQRNWTAPPILNGQHKRRERERFLSPWPEKETRSGKSLPLLMVSAVYGAFGAVHHTTRNARVMRCIQPRCLSRHYVPSRSCRPRSRPSKVGGMSLEGQSRRFEHAVTLSD